MIIELAGIIWPLAAFGIAYLAYRRAGDVIEERRCERDAAREQRSDDLDAFRKDLVGLKSKVNAMALKQGFRGND